MNISKVEEYLLTLQGEVCRALEKLDGVSCFSEENFDLRERGYSQARILQGDGRIEKAAVNFTLSKGDSLPPAASERNQHLRGHSFHAVSLSTIVHPRNPFVPICHMNLRAFLVHSKPKSWHFGGGYDLTPCYGFVEDAVHWHKTAAFASAPYYEEMKKACDDYFFISHRNEHRGIGGLFFDDLNGESFEACFDLVKRIGESFLPAYLPIFKRRMNINYNQSQKNFQLYRRGRYAEFNLVIDRGTKYGLQTGRRVESVLASMPPQAAWIYNYDIEKGSKEEELTSCFLRPRNWLDV